MSGIGAWVLGLILVVVPGTDPEPERAIDTSPDFAVRTILKMQAFPWYDSENDQVKPILPDPSSWTGWLQKKFDAFFDWLDRIFGRRTPQTPRASGGLRGAFATFLILAAGSFLLIMLWRFWRTYTPQASTSPDQAARIGDAARIAGLAPGAALEGMDPWAEAERRRAAGDTAGAVIWLFLDQLMSLQRAGLIRLMPGRTARQYASGLNDPILGTGLRATLGLFEQVYYGHRRPGSEELDRVWSQAETFRRRIQTIKQG